MHMHFNKFHSGVEKFYGVMMTSSLPETFQKRLKNL